MSRSVFDPDPLLRRLERRAVVFCALAAVTAFVVRRGHPDVALGVVGGGILVGASYWAIRSSVDGLVRLISRQAPEAASAEPALAPGAPSGDDGPATAVAEGRVGPRPAAILLRLAGRYALLGVLAYGMIARLRLHPVGLLVGVTSLFAAASIEAFQQATTGAGRHRPRA